MFVDYRSRSGKFYTFRPLPLFKREELSIRFNQFNKYKRISTQIVDDECMEYNLSMILALYSLSLEEFDLEEIDDLLINNILKVNYSQSELKKPELLSLTKSKNSSMSDIQPQEILSKLLSSVWGITDSAGDAIYMVEKIPADILLSTIKNRSEDLERIYSSKDDKIEKGKKAAKEDLLNKLKAKNNES